MQFIKKLRTVNRSIDTTRLEHWTKVDRYLCNNLVYYRDSKTDSYDLFMISAFCLGQRYFHYMKYLLESYQSAALEELALYVASYIDYN